jgi:hypothetical protein
MMPKSRRRSGITRAGSRAVHPARGEAVERAGSAVCGGGIPGIKARQTGRRAGASLDCARLSGRRVAIFGFLRGLLGR